MILIDTSVWVQHFRLGDGSLGRILEENLALTHSFVIGELACGQLKPRKRILADLKALPLAVSATDAEVLELIEEHELWGRGIGWVDAHLLASSRLSGCQLWTRDRQLEVAAAGAGVKTLKFN